MNRLDESRYCVAKVIFRVPLFHQHPPRHARFPLVLGLHGEFRERFIALLREIALPRFPAVVADAVEPPIAAIPVLHGAAAAVADLLVAPVADVEGAVGADLLRDGDEVHVVRPEEVGGVFADVGAGVRVGVVRDEAMAVEVAEEELVAIRRREEAALVDGEAAVRVTAAERVGVVVHHACAGRFVEGDIGSRIAGVVRVVGDGLDVFVSVRVEVLPGLPLIPSAGDDVVEMRNDARGDEPLAMLVVIEPPRVAGAMREDLELMPHGMETPHAGIDGLALVIRRARLTDAAVREDAMAAIQPAVRAPDEAVERFVGVLGAPAVEEDVGFEGESWS